MNAATGKRRTTVLLVLTVATLAAAALVLDRFHVALDLTSSRTWSLSKVSRNLYKDLPDRVHITYYVSPELVARHPGPRQVEEFLRKYEGVGHGLISVSVADPKDLGGPIESLGLKPQRIQVIENNEARVAVVYSGIVVQYLDRTEAVPFVIGLDSLEYDVVKAVNRAVTGKAAMAAVLVGDGDKSWENDYRSVSDALGAAGWTVSVLSPGDAIPPDTGVLLVLGNSAIDDYAAYRIDDYVAHGGSALLAVRGLDVQTSYGLQAVPLKEDALARLLAAWGVSIAPELVLDPSSRTLPFQDQGPGGGLQVRYVKYPHWIIVRPEDCSRTNPVTANLAGLDLMWPSPLSLSARPGVTSEALVKSTAKAWLQTKDFAIGPEEEGSFDREAGGTTGQYLLAASLAGSLPMAYAGKPAPTRKGAAPLPPLPAGSAPSRVIVVGSADFATDLMSLTDSTFNAGFAANAVEWAAYGPDLAALKARGARDNSLSKVADPARRTLIILFAFGLNLVLIPGGLAVVGLVRSRRRKALAQASPPGVPPPSEGNAAGDDGAAAAARPEGGKE
jgi:ABC-type uncharacterized transport system involved in gliding motility auxiliary subunit